MRIPLSIVIINWNTSKILEDCLSSLYKNSDVDRYEVIVVDNDSEDDSVNMVKANYPEVILIENNQNMGFAKANNQAFDIVKGEYILLLNSDTLVLGDVIEKSLSFMRSHPEVGAFGCRVLNPDNTMQATCFQFPTLLNLFLKTSGLFKLPWPKFFQKEHYGHWDRNTEREVDVITGCYFLMPEKVLKETGGFDDTYFFCGEETDLCLRIKKKNWKIMFSPVGEIIHIGNASGRKMNYKRDLLLTQGLVRYHRKHHGVFAGLLVYIVLFKFNLFRNIYWMIKNFFSKSALVKERKVHFKNIVLNYKEAWPTN